MKKSLKSLLSLLLIVSLLMSNFAMLTSFAAIDDYSVELAFNNIFVFDKWANNTLSTTIVPQVAAGQTPHGTLTTNMAEGSATITNAGTSPSKEVYTAHGMETGVNAAGNYQYYYMEVDPGATYSFSYNVAHTTSSVTPFVFLFDKNNEYITLVAQPHTGNGDAQFSFFTPTNAKYIQIRFTLPDQGNATFKDIAIRKTDIASTGNNIYSFDGWAANSYSTTTASAYGYGRGTVTLDPSAKSVTLTATADAAMLFTGFDILSTSNTNYYTMDIEPNATYCLSYNLSSTGSVGVYKPYVVFRKTDGTLINYAGCTAATTTGDNKCLITTPAEAGLMELVYALEGAANGATYTVKDVAIQKINLAADTNADVPHREVYIYSETNPTTYETLPIPSYSYAPDGYVFAGWYTGKDGTGEHITENTPVHYTSYTVYPKYEPIADALSVAQLPVKTTYTVGERVNPTGLALKATINGEEQIITSGYYCTPEYLTTAGAQTITAHYGGKTATFTVTVSASASESVVVNNSTVNASVTNNVYTLNYSGDAFNYYKMTYYSEAYVKGIMTYTDGATEVFFLEPSANFDGETGSFSSYIDGYLDKKLDEENDETPTVTTITHSGITSINFTLLDNKSGSFSLLSIETSKKDSIIGNTTQYFENEKYKLGIDLLNGGVVSELYAINSGIVARTYNTTDPNGNATTQTKVDYASKLPTGHIAESNTVNLINYYDNGRYLQQSYYGTGEKPYNQGYYNSADWNYNPVQGGNVIGEASKVIDYEINTDENYIYIKTRPLDWAKWSEEFAALSTSDAWDAKYIGDEYITDTYVEAKYVFEDGMIKTYCRMVDYSGLPSAQTTQELPAFYTIEPLNQYVYNNVSEEEAWTDTTNLQYSDSPEFWGITQDYITYHKAQDENWKFEPNADSNEHWGAFMASQDPNSFGIGLYSPEVTNFYYGVYPQKYSSTLNSDGSFTQTMNKNYRHAETTNPANEDDSSYIAPIGVRTFESYKPTEYAYYISTGTVNQIRNSFGVIDSEEFAANLASKASIVVPETVYMTPSTGESKTGQYYVNNKLDEATNKFELEAANSEATAFVQFYLPGAKDVKIAVNTLTSGIGDIVLHEAAAITNNISTINSGGYSNSYEGTELSGWMTVDGYFSADTLGLYIKGTGLTAGSTAVAEWVFTVTMDDGSTQTHYAYSTLYAPYYQPVGAAIKLRTSGSDINKSKIFSQSVVWISGVHDFLKTPYTDSTHNTRYADSAECDSNYTTTNNLMPLLNGGSVTDSPNGEKGLIQSDGSGWITANSLGNIRYSTIEGKANDMWLNEVSPTALITVDTSRYNNFSQIPNLTIGLLITDVENATKSHWFLYDYTGQDTSKMGSNYGEDWWSPYGTWIAGNPDTDIGNSDKYRAAQYNGIYPREITKDVTRYVIKSGAHSYGKTNDATTNMWVLLDATLVNKSTLRDLVLKAASLAKENYTEASWNTFKTALVAAATALGNPTNADVSSYNTLNEKMAALQTTMTFVYSSADGTKVVTETAPSTIGDNTSCAHDVSDMNPTRQGYTFMGWSLTENAIEGSKDKITASFNPTFYATWEANEYKLIFDNLFDFKTFNISDGALNINERTETGFTVTATAASDSNTGFSGIIDVTPGKTYILSADVNFVPAVEGKTYDIYLNTLNANKINDTSTTIDLVDTSNGAGKDGAPYVNLTSRKKDTTKPYIKFTAGETTEYVTVRFDANDAGNILTVNNIRFYEVGTVSDGVSYENSVTVTYDSTYGANGNLPVPTRGNYYIFQGWYTADGEMACWDNDKVTITEDTNVYSRWSVNSNSLNDDTLIMDFDGIAFDPFENDTIFMNEVNSGKAYELLGFSTEITDLAKTYNTAFGTFSVVDNKIVYTAKTNNLSSQETIWYHADIEGNDDKNLLYKSFKVTPASNVLYEDTRFEVTNETGVAWKSDGTSANLTQSASSESDIYGYDSAYKGNVGAYSNGTALVAEVSSTNKRSQIQSFTFTGTGFDLYGQCGADTGIMVITVKDSTNKAIKAMVVDTYYNDTNYGTLNQVPIAGARDLDYGTYTVQVAAMYMSTAGAAKNASNAYGLRDVVTFSEPMSTVDMLYEALCDAELEEVFEVDDLEINWFDETSILNGGNGASTYATTGTETETNTESGLVSVIDSVRVYKPLATDDYYIDSEKDAQYFNVMNNLNNNNIVTGSGTFTYVNYDPGAENDQATITLSSYEPKGSNEEFYLTSGITNGLVFTVNKPNDNSKIMVSLRAAAGEAVAKIGEKTITVNSGTEMYYDITDYVAKDGTVTIQNSGSGLLAIGNVKVTNSTAAEPVMMSTFNMRSARMMMMAPPATTEPEVPEETTTEEVTTEETTTEEVTTEEVTTEEVTTEEVTTEEVTTEEVTTEEVTTEEVTTEEATTEEVTTEETTTEAEETTTVPSEDNEETEESFIDKIYAAIDWFVELFRKLMSSIRFITKI